jgi:hypothetical protein
VTLFWGVGEIDRTGDSQWDPDFIGQIQKSQNFDISTMESQNFLVDMCADFKTLAFVVTNSASCWPLDFKDYIENTL